MRDRQVKNLGKAMVGRGGYIVYFFSYPIFRRGNYGKGRRGHEKCAPGGRVAIRAHPAFVTQQPPFFDLRTCVPMCSAQRLGLARVQAGELLYAPCVVREYVG